MATESRSVRGKGRCRSRVRLGPDSGQGSPSVDAYPLKERSLALTNYSEMSVIQKEARFRVGKPAAGLTCAASAAGTPLSFEESEFLIQLGGRLRGIRALREMSRRELAR